MFDVWLVLGIVLLVAALGGVASATWVLVSVVRTYGKKALK